MEVRWDLAFKGSAPQATTVDLKYRRQWWGRAANPVPIKLGNHPKDSDPEYFPLLTLVYGFKHLWCNTFKGHNRASVRIYSTEERRLHATCLETAKKAMESFGLFE